MELKNTVKSHPSTEEITNKTSSKKKSLGKRVLSKIPLIGCVGSRFWQLTEHEW